MTKRGRLAVKLHVLVAAVTAAERKDPMPTTAELSKTIGCAPHGISMAVSDLETRGLIRRLNAKDSGGRLRLMICSTGSATAEVA